MAKKKVAAKKKVSVQSKERSKMDPLMKEVSEVTEELEDILTGLRTSTVSFTRDRIKLLIERLKDLGES